MTDYRNMDLGDVARLARREAPPGADTVLVGPPLIYGDERVCLFLCLGKRGRRSHVVSVDLGRHEPAPADDPPNNTNRPRYRPFLPMFGW